MSAVHCENGLEPTPSTLRLLRWRGGLISYSSGTLLGWLAMDRPRGVQKERKEKVHRHVGTWGSEAADR